MHTPKQGDGIPASTGTRPGSSKRGTPPPGQESRENGHEQETEERFHARVTKEERRDAKWDIVYGDKRDPRIGGEEHIVRILTHNISSFPKVGR